MAGFHLGVDLADSRAGGLVAAQQIGPLGFELKHLRLQLLQRNILDRLRFLCPALRSLLQLGFLAGDLLQPGIEQHAGAAIVRIGRVEFAYQACCCWLN